MYRMKILRTIESLDLKFWGTKVHQKADIDSGCFEIIDNLSLMFREHPSYSFQLNNELFLNQNISKKLPHNLTAKLNLEGDV